MDEEKVAWQTIIQLIAVGLLFITTIGGLGYWILHDPITHILLNFFGEMFFTIIPTSSFAY